MHQEVVALGPNQKLRDSTTAEIESWASFFFFFGHAVRQQYLSSPTRDRTLAPVWNYGGWGAVDPQGGPLDFSIGISPECVMNKLPGIYLHHAFSKGDFRQQ